MLEWFRRLNLERIYFVIHRLTGIYLVLYIFPRPYLVLLSGSWEEALRLDMTPIGKMLAIIFIFSILFHGINGLRIVLIELGLISGRPLRHPIKPIPALRANKLHLTLIVATIVLTVVGMVVGSYLVLYGKEHLLVGP
ncbi:MAG: succinate dehydrogenase [Thermoproteus sp.]|nr:succinate dehydrogenase [Thermoproteus sp.]MDT7882449.1 succinate dehydrogenase [Thermoproteus sp.]